MFAAHDCADGRMQLMVAAEIAADGCSCWLQLRSRLMVAAAGCS